MGSNMDLSVVIPIYNEEESVSSLYLSLKEACDRLNLRYEILFIDDGSTDHTYAMLSRLYHNDPMARTVKFRKNYGQTAAMAAGFRVARGKIIVSMDGDLQNDPADISRLLKKVEEGYDVVCGWRKDRKDKLISRRVPSIIANWLIGKITGVPIHDNGCSLKAYRSKVIKQVALYSELHRFIPAMATLSGASIAEIVVTHHSRKFGKSKYGISRAWRVFSDLFLIKMLTDFSARPALWFGVLSIPFFFFGMTCLIGWLISSASGIVIPTLTFLSFSLVGHFIAMGVLGEMVLNTGDFRPEQMLSEITIRER